MNVRPLLAAELLMLATGASAPLHAQAVPPVRVTTPKEQFGANFGDEYFLANYKQISEYWRKLEKESPRLKVQNMGKTAEGRDQLIVIVTSPENQRQLEKYREISARLTKAEGLTDDQAHALANRPVPLAQT
ncbi:MAG: hypothetical protein ABJD07_07365 [Gemmatimonadaceae bacterium]